MSIVDQALQTQLANIEKRSGKNLKELVEIVRESGESKHSEIRKKLMADLGLGYGDATMLTGYAMKTLNPELSDQDALPLDAIVNNLYSGPKADLRPIHDKLMSEIEKFGDFEIAPKKNYLSLRRKRQFATIGPATRTRVDLGLNMKGFTSTERLIELAPGGMCQYQVRLSDAGEVDAELISWIKAAYDSSGE